MIACGECRYWDPSGMPSDASGAEWGECCRHAPRPLPRGTPLDGQNGEIETLWPETLATSGCGEGKKKQPRPGVS